MKIIMLILLLIPLSMTLYMGMDMLMPIFKKKPKNGVMVEEKSAKEHMEEIKLGGSGLWKVINASPPDDFLGEGFETQTDELLIYESRMGIFFQVIFSIPLVALLAVLVNIFFINPSPWDSNAYIAFFIALISFIIPALYGLAFVLYNPNRKFIFNRMTGMVTMPAYKWRWWKKATITKHFYDIGFRIIGGTRTHPRLHIGIPGSLEAFLLPFISVGKNMEKDFSALVWYMDRNRPLPPGKQFDPYREKDDERRRAAGYPAPIYPTNVVALLEIEKKERALKRAEKARIKEEKAKLENNK